jgi:hypothetical protein
VIERFFENFEMPIVKIRTTAITRFLRAGVRFDKVARERDDRRFKDLEPALFIRIQIFSVFAFRFGIEIGYMLEETGRIERRHRQSGEIGRPAILQRVALDRFPFSCASSGPPGAIPSGKIQFGEFAVLGELLRSFGDQRASEQNDRTARSDDLGFAHIGFLNGVTA